MKAFIFSARFRLLAHSAAHEPSQNKKLPIARNSENAALTLPVISHYKRKRYCFLKDVNAHRRDFRLHFGIPEPKQHMAIHLMPLKDVFTGFSAVIGDKNKFHSPDFWSVRICELPPCKQLKPLQLQHTNKNLAFAYDD